MLKRALAAVSLLSLLLSAPTPTTAQVSGFAFVSLAGYNDLFAEGGPFVGPWRATAIGMDIKYTVMCIEVGTGRKRPLEVIATIPNGQFSNTRAISTAAVVAGCGADGGINVAAGAVFLPVLQPGL